MSKPLIARMAKPKQSGSAMLWTLIWLTGMAAIAFFCLIRHQPALERAAHDRLKTSLATVESDGIESSIEGYTATLRGNVENATQKDTILALAADTPGIKTVVDKITQNDIPVAKADDTTPVIGVQAQVQEENDTSTDEEPSADTSEESNSSTADTEESEPTAATNEVQSVPSEPEVNTATSEPTEAAQLNMEIDDGTLFVDGQIAETDDIDILIIQAKVSLGADFVSNSAENKKEVIPATWTQAITAFIPAMAVLETPGIQIKNNQITLSGTAPEKQTHDGVIKRALELLGDYSLVERIDIVEPATADQETTKDTATEQETTTTAQSDNAARDEAIEAVADAETPAAEIKPEQELEVSAPEPVAEPPESSSDKQTDAADTEIDDATEIRAAFEALPSKTILFESGNAILTTESQTVLDDIAQLLKDFPDAGMDIDGHTDASGDAQANLELSQERANAVRDYLIDQGISVYRLAAYGFGEGVPIAKNNTPEGRALNRRIEFKF